MGNTNHVLCNPNRSNICIRTKLHIMSYVYICQVCNDTFTSTIAQDSAIEWCDDCLDVNVNVDVDYEPQRKKQGYSLAILWHKLIVWYGN